MIFAPTSLGVISNVELDPPARLAAPSDIALHLSAFPYGSCDPANVSCELVVRVGRSFSSASALSPSVNSLLFVFPIRQ